MLCCLAVQLQVFRFGVTTKDPDSGPVPQEWDVIDSSDQYWTVYIESDGCRAKHKRQARKLQWALDRSEGNTFGCHVSGTGELHLHHNGRDVGVAWEGLSTDQPLWGFLVLRLYKVEANYVIAQSEAVCVSVCMSSWPLRWKVFIYMTCIQLHTFHCATIHVMSVSSPVLQCAWSLLIIRTDCTLRLRCHFRELHPLLGACML